jgi:hypothetical protein
MGLAFIHSLSSDRSMENTGIQLTLLMNNIANVNFETETESVGILETTTDVGDNNYQIYLISALKPLKK